MRTRRRFQLDLFATPQGEGELPSKDRLKAVALLQALLTEAVADSEAEPATAKDAGEV